jgi:putative inorganic carbon (hco3(-)) transporter
MPRLAFYLACGSAVAALVSIAICQILLGAALGALPVNREPVRIPRIWLPLSIFLALTLIALAVSSDPRAGFPQVKKLYVYLMLPVVFTAIRRVEEIRPLIWAWAAAASASGLWSFVQFWIKRQHALAQHGDFYLAYVADRATGFMGHWMTFGAAQMAAMMLLLSALMFAPPRRYRWLCVSAAVVIAASIVLGWTRGVWLATGVGSIYLLAVWRPKYLLLVPVALVLGWFIAPRSVRQRVVSIYQPHGEVDSNRHRYVTRRTGMEMIKAHPWFGLGPEMPGKQFQQYVPADIKRPLPEGFYGHLHNIYLQYAAERGVPALLAFLWIIGMMLHDWWTRARSQVTNERRAILHGAMAVLIAFLIEGLFEHNLGDSEVLSMFWIVTAWGYRAWEAEA